MSKSALARSGQLQRSVVHSPSAEKNLREADHGARSSEIDSRFAEIPLRPRWKPILVFFIFVYAGSVGIGLQSSAAPLKQVVWLTFFPAICAALVFWRQQQWKFMAQNWKFRQKIWEEALDSLAREAANATNAIRANLMGFRLANPQLMMPAHLEEIEMGTKRIETVIQQAQDPITWKGNTKKPRTGRPGIDMENTRSQISL